MLTEKEKKLPFHQKLELLLERVKISRKVFAQQINVTERRVYKWLDGSEKPNRDNYNRIIELYPIMSLASSIQAF
jgi:DNA-binding transcriptional regulator YiaG